MTTIVDGLRCEHLTDPLGVEAHRPRLSWRITSQERQVLQLAYRVEAATSYDRLMSGNPDLWDSGRVASGESRLVEHGGSELASRAECHWRVSVWTRLGTSTSLPARFEMGLLRPSDWSAAWVSDPARVDRNQGRPSYLRKAFELDGKPVRARLYATALGLYLAEINGRRAGDDVFRPGWTEYSIRTPYQVYDVTDLLRSGENVLGAVLGDGWYSGHVAWLPLGYYGKVPRLRMQLEATMADGRRVTVGTDQTWRAVFGPIRTSDMLKGEHYDARRHVPGWSSPGTSLPRSRTVFEVAEPTQLVSQLHQSVRRVGEVKPAGWTCRPDGEVIFDLGQNMVGWVRLRVRGRRGDRVRVRHAEMLRRDGGLYRRNLRDATSTDVYVCRGDGEETYEPSFTFHGFRYVGVRGVANPSAETITGVVVHTDMPITSCLETSSGLVNQLQSNIVWSQRGNSVEVPTDCPQRDERLGWTGDAQVFIRTATYNMDVAGFFTKWLRDMRDAQHDDGAYHDHAPAARLWPGGAPWPTASPAWGDAGVIVPWALYLAYGDRQILSDHLESMERWIHYVSDGNRDNLWRERVGYNYGDWLAIGETTPKDLMATAYFAQSTGLVGKAAAALGEERKAAEYACLRERIVAAFNREFVSSDGTLHHESQTGYVLALHFDLLPERLRCVAADRLVALIEEAGWHLRTGFMSVGHLMFVLTAIGRLDVAYRLLMNTTFPSWGYSIVHGATTIWERWDGWTEQRGFQDPVMNSFNHYSLGSVGAWLFGCVAGIDTDPEQPGYQRVLLAPRPGGGLRHVNARFDSPRGPILSRWEMAGDDLRFQFEIPAGSSALATLPAHGAGSVREGGDEIEHSAGVEVVRSGGSEVQLALGSGSYDFVCENATDLAVEAV